MSITSFNERAPRILNSLLNGETYKQIAWKEGVSATLVRFLVMRCHRMICTEAWKDDINLTSSFKKKDVINNIDMYRHYLPKEILNELDV